MNRAALGMGRVVLNCREKRRRFLNSPCTGPAMKPRECLPVESLIDSYRYIQLWPLRNDPMSVRVLTNVPQRSASGCPPPALGQKWGRSPARSWMDEDLRVSLFVGVFPGRIPGDLLSTWLSSSGSGVCELGRSPLPVGKYLQTTTFPPPRFLRARSTCPKKRKWRCKVYLKTTRFR